MSGELHISAALISKKEQEMWWASESVRMLWRKYTVIRFLGRPSRRTVAATQQMLRYPAPPHRTAGYRNFPNIRMSNPTCISAPTNLTDWPNGLTCHVISCPVVPPALPIPVSGAFAKLRTATTSFVMSACTSLHPSARKKELGSQRAPFHEIWNCSISRKSVQKIQV